MMNYIYTVNYLPVQTDSCPDPDFDGHTELASLSYDDIKAFIINQEADEGTKLEWSEWTSDNVQIVEVIDTTGDEDVQELGWYIIQRWEI